MGTWSWAGMIQGRRVEQTEGKAWVKTQGLGLPWWSSGWDFMLLLQGTRVQPLVRALRYYILCGQKRKEGNAGDEYQGTCEELWRDWHWKGCTSGNKQFKRLDILNWDKIMRAINACLSLHFCWPQWTCEKGCGTADNYRLLLTTFPVSGLGKSFHLYHSPLVNKNDKTSNFTGLLKVKWNKECLLYSKYLTNTALLLWWEISVEGNDPDLVLEVTSWGQKEDASEVGERLAADRPYLNINLQSWRES